MKKKMYLMAFAGTISFFLLFCDRNNSCEDSIADIDVITMVLEHLPDFTFIRDYPKDSIKTEYVFTRKVDSALLIISMGLYKSEDEALNIANEYVKSISIHMEEGHPDGISIGDAFWYWAPGPEFSIMKNIVFVRTNALFVLSGPAFEDLVEPLAISIDSDILNEASHITCGN